MRERQCLMIDSYAQGRDRPTHLSEMKRSRSAGNINESSSSKRFESPRSHAELRELENFGMDGAGEIYTDNSVRRRRRLRPSNPAASYESPVKESSSLQPNQSTRSGSRSSSRPRPTRSSPASVKTSPVHESRSSRSASLQPNSIRRRNRNQSSSASTKTPSTDVTSPRQAPHRSCSKTKSLLDRLNRSRESSTSKEDAKVGSAAIESDGTPVRKRALTSARIPPSSQKELQVSSSPGARPKRISVREVRLQQKAATALQALARRFLARSSNRSNLLQKQYLKYVEDRRKNKTRLEQERLAFMSKLMSLQRQTQNEIDYMQMQKDDEKKKIEASLRESLAYQLDHGVSEDHLEETMTQMNEEKTRLKNEHDRLASEVSLMEGLLSDLEEERDNLQAINDKVMNMFTVLNHFAKSSVAEKKKLEAEAKVYNKVEVSKVRHELKICSSGAIVETAAKEMYRGSMYRHVYNNVKSLCDQELFEKSMGIIKECEESIGNQVLTPEEAKRLLERKENDSDSDEEEDS